MKRRRRGLGRLLGLLGLGVLGFAPAVAAAEEPVVNLQLEAGSELDTNAHRETSQAGQTYAPVAAAVGRGGIRWSLGWRPRPGRALHVSAIAAAKKFVGQTSVDDEDVAVLAGDLRFDMRLGERPLVLGTRLSYYDAIERSSQAGPDHDFRTGNAALALTLLGERSQRATLTAGLRAFEYKPDSRYDFAGEHVQLDWKKTIEPGADGTDALDDGPTWDLAAWYGLSRRAYADHARINTCAPDAQLDDKCLPGTEVGRVDIAHQAGAEVSYTGERIYSARYLLAVTLSNSFGESALRHRLELSATSETFWSVFVTVRAALQVNQFLDPLLLSSSTVMPVTIEDESRNTLTLHATRDFGAGAHWAVEARWSFYSNEFATQELLFRRQTAYLGLVWRL